MRAGGGIFVLTMILKCPRIRHYQDLSELIGDSDIRTLGRCVKSIYDLDPALHYARMGERVTLYLCWKHAASAASTLRSLSHELAGRRHDGLLRGGREGKVSVILLGSSRPIRNDPATSAVLQAVRRSPDIKGYIVSFLPNGTGRQNCMLDLAAMAQELSLGRMEV